MKGGVTIRRAAVGVIIGFVLAGCLPAADPWTAPAATGPGNGHHVGVIGDTTVYQAQNGSDLNQRHTYLTTALTNLDFYVSTSIGIGADTPDLLHDADSSFVGFPSPGADIQIIALGTNDAHDNWIPVATYEANLRRYIDGQPAKTCLGLVNLFTGNRAWNLAVTAPAYNDAINRIVADHTNVHLIDWNTYALAHPDLYPDPSNPYPNASGQAAYRLFISIGATSCAQALDAH